ncbi:MAG: redoxin domain-containing protein [Actinomycetota bacterium]|nr:redoxin domain-containing protein [Actinomycetota bacterium]MDP2289296.1 redoxin domain-containing protein [Actinomycetota bacterium]
MPSIGLAIGVQAPDFQLPDHRGGKVRLQDLREQRAVLLVFFPFAFTEVCSSEFRALQSKVKAFEHRGVTVLGISCDSPYALAEFATREQLTLDLLSDFWPHGAVCREYGVLLDDKGFAMRGSFLVNRKGNIVWSLLNGPADERDPREYENAIARLG